MKAKIARAWRSLSPAQAAVLIALVVTAGWLASRVPPEAWEALAEKDPTELGARIALFVLAVVGVFTRGRSSS